MIREGVLPPGTSRTLPTGVFEQWSQGFPLTFGKNYRRSVSGPLGLPVLSEAFCLLYDFRMSEAEAAITKHSDNLALPTHLNIA